MKKLHALLTFLFLTLFVNANSFAEPLNRIIAYVNKDVITAQQYDRAYQLTTLELQSRHMPIPAPAELKKKVLDHLIDQSLQLQKAKDVGIVVNDTMVNEAIAHLAKQNNFTIAQFKDIIEKQGMSFSEYKENLRQQITLNKLQQQALGGNITVTPQEVDQALHKATKASIAYRYHVLDNVIPLDEKPTPAAKKQALASAQKLIKALHQGNTTPTDKAIQQSDLGMRALEDLPSLFTNAVEGLATHGVSAPITAPNGIHVLYLVEKQALKNNAPAPTRAEAEQMVYGEKMDAAAKKFATQLRQGAYIKIVT